MASTAIAERKATEKRINSLLYLLDDGLEERVRLAGTLKESTDEVIDSIKELAVGVWVEKDVPNRDGSTEKRVYQRAPDVKAARVFLEMANIFQADIANTLLSLARAQKEVASIRAGLPSGLAELTKAQTKLFEGQAAVFTKALAEKSEIPPLVQSISATAIGFLQHIGREGLEKAGQSEESFQNFLERFVRAMDNALARALETMGAEVETEEEEEWPAT